jgi:CheY-like chemotaxis protein
VHRTIGLQAAAAFVEDQETCAVCPLLTGSGYDIIEAADGSEGVAKARADLPDLMLMDIQLPVL